MTPDHLCTLTSPELLQPIWKEIDSLNEREYYKEAYQYLRIVTNELSLLHESTLAVNSLLNVNPHDSWSLRRLQMLLERQLKPIRDFSLLRYIESLRIVLQGIHQTFHYQGCCPELEKVTVELCDYQCERLENEDLDQTTDWGFELNLPPTKLH